MLLLRFGMLRFRHWISLDMISDVSHNSELLLNLIRMSILFEKLMQSVFHLCFSVISSILGRSPSIRCPKKNPPGEFHPILRNLRL